MNLRELHGILPTPPQREHAPFSRCPEGIPRGGITEIAGAPGSGKTALAVRFLAEHPELQAAWIEERLTVYPSALPLHGVELARVVFIEAGEHVAWTALQALESGAFQVVVLASAREIPEVPMRRIQLAAEKAQATVFLLSERPQRQGRWAFALELEAAHG